jgi:hypothetical protein
MAPFGREKSIGSHPKEKKKAQRRAHDFDNQEAS